MEIVLFKRKTKQKIEPVQAEELKSELVTKPAAYGAKMTFCIVENPNMMVKTYIENSDLHLSVSCKYASGWLINLNPCGHS